MTKLKARVKHILFKLGKPYRMIRNKIYLKTLNWMFRYGCVALTFEKCQWGMEQDDDRYIIKAINHTADERELYYAHNGTYYKKPIHYKIKIEND